MLFCLFFRSKVVDRENKARVAAFKTPPHEDAAPGGLASRRSRPQLHRGIEEWTRVARSNNECLSSISDKSSHGPAIVRVCQVEMIRDANWKTIYNLFKIISCGYLLLDCSQKHPSKKFGGSFFQFFFLFFSSFPLPLNNTLARRHAWSSREKKKSGMPAVVLKPQWQHNSRSLYLITFQLNLGIFLQTTNISFFVKPDVCTPNVHASLWQPRRGSRWKTGIDLRAAEKWNVQGAGRANVL